MRTLTEVWGRAVTCEVGWHAGGREFGAIAAVPLLDGDRMCVALPYVNADLLARVVDGTAAAFTVTDPHSSPTATNDTDRTDGMDSTDSMAGTGDEIRGVAAIGPVRRFDDITGDRFVAELLEQELRKHPPSRALADSRLLRREHWWWLPRIMLWMDPSARTVELPARTDPTRHGLLFRPGGRDEPGDPDSPSGPNGPGGSGGPGGTTVRVDVVEVDPDPGESAAAADRGRWLRALDGEALDGDGDPAMLFGHDYTVPDLERWESWSVRGELFGSRLTTAEAEGTPGADLAPLALRARLRRHRELERRCRSGITRTERAARRR